MAQVGDQFVQADLQLAGSRRRPAAALRRAAGCPIRRLRARRPGAGVPPVARPRPRASARAPASAPSGALGEQAGAGRGFGDARRATWPTPAVARARLRPTRPTLASGLGSPPAPSSALPCSRSGLTAAATCAGPTTAWTPGSVGDASLPAAQSGEPRRVGDRAVFGRRRRRRRAIRSRRRPSWRSVSLSCAGRVVLAAAGRGSAGPVFSASAGPARTRTTAPIAIATGAGRRRAAVTNAISRERSPFGARADPPAVDVGPEQGEHRAGRRRSRRATLSTTTSATRRRPARRAASRARRRTRPASRAAGCCRRRRWCGRRCGGSSAAASSGSAPPASSSRKRETISSA